ncbi:MAG: hypothetical protein E6J17_10715 [Chloroflexi bacterium]|nr:MAG: hypothetical protein E6J17_10715 [Chloroflexota bacterium]
MYAHDQRQAEAEILPVCRRERRPLRQLAEDRHPPAIVVLELECHEAAARQEIEPGVEHPTRLSLGSRSPSVFLGPQLKQYLRWDALEGGIEQQEALVDGETQRLVGLVQPALALAPELARHVPVGHGGDDGDRDHSAAHKKQEEAAPEPALQRCRG